METIGNRIKKARNAEGLTQAQLGQRCGMADSAIRRYESGRGNPTLVTLQRIADALDIPVGELLGTVPQPDREWEKLCDLLSTVDLSIEAASCTSVEEYDDHYYVWHTGTQVPEEDRVEITYRDLLNLVDSIEQDANRKKQDYIRKRLDAELFTYPSSHLP